MAAIDFGLGLRPEHYEEIAASPGRVSWFEALSENYMVPGGGPVYWLERIRRKDAIDLGRVWTEVTDIETPSPTKAIVRMSQAKPTARSAPKPKPKADETGKP